MGFFVLLIGTTGSSQHVVFVFLLPRNQATTFYWNALRWRFFLLKRLIATPGAEKNNGLISDGRSGNRD